MLLTLLNLVGQAAYARLRARLLVTNRLVIDRKNLTKILSLKSVTVQTLIHLFVRALLLSLLSLLESLALSPDPSV